jgi:hypothetical protein
LERVITIGVDEVKDFFTVCSDGFFQAKPLLIHLRMLKAFSLSHMQTGQELFTALKDDDNLNMKKAKTTNYCFLANYFTGVVTFGSTVMAQTSPKIDANTWGR